RTGICLHHTGRLDGGLGHCRRRKEKGGTSRASQQGFSEFRHRHVLHLSLALLVPVNPRRNNARGAKSLRRFAQKQRRRSRNFCAVPVASVDGRRLVSSVFADHRAAFRVETHIHTLAIGIGGREESFTLSRGIALCIHRL